MSAVRYGVLRVEHRAEHPVLARQRPERRDQLVAHPGGEELREAALAVGKPERGVASVGQLPRAVHQPLEHLLHRALRGDREHRVADGPKRRTQLLGHPGGLYAPGNWSRQWSEQKK